MNAEPTLISIKIEKLIGEINGIEAGRDSTH